MDIGYYIAGSVFLALSIVWAVFKNRASRNKQKDEAIRDAKSAIDGQDTVRFVDALRRRLRFKKRP